MKRLSTSLGCAAVIYLMASPAHAVMFDFSWSSGSGTYIGSGPIDPATGSATGTFSLDIADGAFTESNLTALDIAVMTDNVGTVNYGLPANSFDGTYDSATGTVTFTDILLIAATGQFFAVGGGGAFAEQCIQGACSGVTHDIWEYGSASSALATLTATIRPPVTGLTEPGTLWMLLLGFSAIAWIRWSILK